MSNRIPSILPPSSTPFERAVEQTAAARFAALAPAISSIWNADTCPKQLLPYLAWSLSVDEWDDGWGEDKKRQVIRESRYVHQHKGTFGAVKRALAALGQVNATVVERLDCFAHNGAAKRDGTRRRMGQAGWPTYRVILASPVTIGQAHQIRRVLAAVQRNCVHLRAVDYQQSGFARNGTLVRNGAYTRGVVDTTLQE